MPTTEILPFATDESANVQSQVDYAAATSTDEGFSSGIAEASKLNKVWRQSSFIAAGIANWIVSKGADVPDDGDVDALVSKFDAAVVAALPSGIPTATMLPFAGASAPSGYLFCAGQAVSRDDFSDLFDAVGTAYGVGDGSTTFNIPDLRGRTPFGKDNMGGSAASRITNAISGIEGATLGAVGGDQRMQQHNHDATFTANPHSHTTPGSAGGTDNGGVDNAVDIGENIATSSATVTGTVTIDNEGAGSSQNMPPAIIMNFIIKT